MSDIKIKRGNTRRLSSIYENQGTNQSGKVNTGKRGSVSRKPDSWITQPARKGYETDYDPAYIQELRKNVMKWDGNINKKHTNLQSGWSLRSRTNNGKTEYWYENEKTGVTQWEPPL